MQQWEYLVLERTVDLEKHSTSWSDGVAESLERRLNKLGREGWELVSENSMALVSGGYWAGHTTDITFILKRPVR